MQACAFWNALCWNPSQGAPQAALEGLPREAFPALLPASTCLPALSQGLDMATTPLPSPLLHETLRQGTIL